MPCGKRPIRKLWDRSRHIKVITPSRFEQNEASVKVHWRKVTHDLERLYKDDQFWETQAPIVSELVGPVIFQRLVKIFSLPKQEEEYVPQSEKSSIVASETVYKFDVEQSQPRVAEANLMVELQSDGEEEEIQEEEEESEWSTFSEVEDQAKIKSITKVKSQSVSRTKWSKSVFVSNTLMKSISRIRSTVTTEDSESADEPAYTDDDIFVNASYRSKRRRVRFYNKNPHFDMLYCNESETDMIKWKSKYKQKTFEVSASDEFSKKAEILTKMIAKDFFEWWTALGNVEFNSEIRRPEDIEELFQVWFDEHASRGLVLHPKIIPCVLSSIAKYVGVPQSSCSHVLKKQVSYDIKAETSPAKTTAFDTSLPDKMKHIPPRNNTKQQWRCVKIPQDLKTMACVWEDITHLTSTKAFQRWLAKRPNLPMPKCLKTLGEGKEAKQLFVVPSDYVVKDKDAASTQELALPVSQFSMELKEVLSKLMNP